MFEIANLPTELGERKNAPLLTGILRGIEREALRVSKDGKFSHKDHPKGMGSALTHPMITTDFSESLLEFITPPTHQVEDLFLHLDNIHRFALSQMDGEMLWTNSMPCALPTDENNIPVALYGSSNNGRMKTIYRVGLGHRYGRAMQTVAGIHYNFSLPDAFWAHFHTKENSPLSLEEYKNQRYFSMIRNFRRNFWLLILLFGASPAMCASFIGDRQHNLDVFPGNKALYLPHATSLRMGDLGYQSSAQESLFICYNQKNTYIDTLGKAILTPFEGYNDIGADSKEHQQLSDGLLQIENEFYSSIRPKRTAKAGETALTALKNRGVEYIEVRCLDINPFDPLGISAEQVAFLDTFLLHCALSDSPDADNDEFYKILRNQKAVVNRGREPELMLEHPELGKISLESWAKSLMDAMQPVASLLDSAYENDTHNAALSTQRETITDLDRTPSAQILSTLAHGDTPFSENALSIALENDKKLRENALSEERMATYAAIAEESTNEQAEIEANSTESFDEFLKAYYKQYEKLL